MSNNSYYNDQWRIINEPNQNKVSNYSMEFDHTNANSINVGNTLTNGFSQLTVSVWVNFSSFVAGKNYGLVSKDGLGQRSFDLRYINGTGVNFLVSTNGTGASGSSYYPVNSINIGQWYHFVGVYDGSNVLLYVDGTLIGTPTALTGSLQNTTSDFFIGIRAAAPTTTTFDGKIDQVTIFDYALPATGTNSVATLYGSGTAVTNPMSLSPKPIAAYQLGDQSVDNGANYLVPNNSLSDYVFDFDGVNDYLDCGNDSSLQITGAMTVSYWFNGQGGSGTIGGFGKLGGPNNRGFCLGLNNNNQITFYIAPTINSLVSASYSHTTDNNWHHLLGVFTPSTSLELYFDGVLVATTSTSVSSQYNGSNNLQIGARGDGAGPFNGKMSNVALWDTALTGPQVATIYNNGAPNDISSLSPVAWYKLNAADTFDGTNWTINDYGSGGNDGTSSGMTSANLITSDLQQTSAKSIYALDFDGVNDYLKTNTIPTVANSITISAWVKRTGNAGYYAGVFGVRNSSQLYGMCGDLVFGNNDNKIIFRINESHLNTPPIKATSNNALTNNTWTHVVGVADGTKLYLYINGVRQTSQPTYNGNINTPLNNIYFANQGNAGYPFNGQLSNCARWNIALTQAQVTEIYNQGVPSDLNAFSGTAPVGWWQLGSNSSYGSGAWTCLDEIGTDNAVSVNMTNNDIVDGVGYSASGLGTSSIDIVGDAPYSTANGLGTSSIDRTTDVPS